MPTRAANEILIIPVLPRCAHNGRVVVPGAYRRRMFARKFCEVDRRVPPAGSQTCV
jgi:hypothetical protein